MESTVKQRLTAFIEYKAISKSEFGRIIGVSSAFITSMRKSIQPDKVESIAFNFPDLNIEWLITGEGEMLRTEKKVENNSTNNSGVNQLAGGNIENSPITVHSSDFVKLLQKKDEQIDRLLTLLENK